MKEFFELPPKHDFSLGDLVTCNCHGGVALIIALYDNPEKDKYPKMNMAKIWWIKYPHAGVKERVWMHSIKSLKKYRLFKKTAPKISQTLKETTVKYKYTCWHCGTGMVIKLPAKCPECDRMLTKQA